MTTVHMHKNAYFTGYDGIATFTLCVHTEGPPMQPLCANCRKHSLFTIRYKDGVDGITTGLKSRYAGLEVENTMLKSPKNCLCLNCWPKFQRQILHIATAGGKK